VKRCRSRGPERPCEDVEVDVDVVASVDLNGDVNVDSLVDVVRGPPGGLRILSKMVKVEVDGGLNVHGHVKLNDGRQRQGPGQRPRDAGALGKPTP
jgi:hypothetical protein